MPTNSTDSTPIDRFLDEPVPPSGTLYWRDWQARCREFSPSEAIPAFIEALQEGSESRQYSALLGLRLFGFSAFAEGDGPERVYRISSDATSEEVIKPKHLPDVYEP
jgi:hypothetical protein